MRRGGRQRAAAIAGLLLGLQAGAASADEAIWPARQDAVTLPFTLVNNHIYVEMSVNGRLPAPFLFDTGAVGTLDRAHAAWFGVTPEGTLAAAGFGDHIRRSGVGSVAQVTLGGLTLDGQDFLVLDLARIADADGTALAGLVGYEFVREAVTIIDYQARTIRLVKPESFHPPTGGTALKLEIDDHAPVVAASLDGIAGRFELDTGNRGSLSLMRPFVEHNRLLEKYRPGIEAVTGYGVGGPTRSLVARVGALTLGDIAVPAPVVDLEQDRHGLAASIRLSGDVGGGILKRFTVTLDYAGGHAYLEPNGSFTAPDIYDRSGLWLMAERDGVRIDDVAVGGPAAKTGLRAGDRILAIDGVDATSLSLAELRERLRGAPGTAIRLAIERNGRRRNVRLVLADLV